MSMIGLDGWWKQPGETWRYWLDRHDWEFFLGCWLAAAIIA
jgi:hypothetical protein